MASKLANALFLVKTNFLRTDFRAYPSRKMTSGYDASWMKKMVASQVPEALLKAGPGLQQNTGEDMIDELNIMTRHQIEKLCERQKMSYVAWRKETIFALRVILSHIGEKARQHAKAP